MHRKYMWLTHLQKLLWSHVLKLLLSTARVGGDSRRNTVQIRVPFHSMSLQSIANLQLISRSMNCHMIIIWVPERPRARKLIAFTSECSSLSNWPLEGSTQEAARRIEDRTRSKRATASLTEEAATNCLRSRLCVGVAEAKGLSANG